MKVFRAVCDCGFDRTYTTGGRAELGLDRHQCSAHRRRHRRSCRTCGWSGVYSSAARADYGKRRHSCARQLAATQRRARGAERRAAVDRTPQPCRHPRAQHVHGTSACYVHDVCRCVACATAHSQYEATRARLKAYGRWHPFVDAGSARDHIQALTCAGMGLKRIAEVSGMSPAQLSKVLNGSPGGPRAQIRGSTQARILAVQVDLAAGARVDGTGTARRLQALVALGWSQVQLAARLGVAPTNLTPLIHCGRRSVVVATAQAVTVLYDELSMTLPPQITVEQQRSVARAQGTARRRGWVPPLAWEEEALDDPAARPHTGAPQTSSRDLVDDVVVQRRLDGQQTRYLTPAETLEALSRGRARGMSIADLERVGLKPDRYGIYAGRGHQVKARSA